MGRTARTVTVSLPPELASRIDELVEQQGWTRSELVRTALREYLERLDRWDRIFEYGERQAERLGLSEDDVLRSIMKDRRKWRRWKAPRA